MKLALEPGWKQALAPETDKLYFQKLRQFVYQEYQQKTVYPPAKKIFAAFDLAPLDRVKVVIIGQDPYHGPGQAMGLSFSVPENIKLPPSLRNIYKELADDLKIKPPKSGDLSGWAQQGVLLLNATLTVRSRQAGSHQKRGWEQFTDAAINVVSNQRENCVFLLWGSYAQQKAKLIDADKHLILKAPHPSPLSAHRGFFGCKHFSQTNDYLWMHGKEPIDWQATKYKKDSDTSAG